VASLRQLYVTLNLRADNFNNGLRAVQHGVKDLVTEIKPSIKAMNDLGRTATAAGGALTAGITVPLAAAATVSVKAAMDFESSFAGVRKTVDATEKEFSELSAGFRKMATEIPVSVNELNKIGEAAGQLGIKKDDIVQFTRTMALLGETTNLTSDQAATATANIQNIFGAAGKDVDRFGATLVALGNAGASTEQDIIEMAKRIAGTGHLVGLTQAQVLSFASALSSVGINAEAGGSAISRVFLKINNAVADGGKSLDEFARVAGMNSAAFKKAFQEDAAGAMVSFISGLGRLKAEGENVNATIEGVVGKNIILKDTLLRASGAGDLLTQTLELGNKAWQENSALVKEAEQRHRTFESQMKLLWGTVNDVAITLGAVLIPIILNVLEGLKPVIAVVAQLAEWFSELPVPIQTVAVVVLALVAAIGPLLLAFGFLATSIAGIIPAVLGAVAAIGTFGAPILAVVAGIAVWTAAIVSVGTALVLFITQNEELRAAVLEAWNAIKEGAAELWPQIVDLFRTISAELKAIWAEWGPAIKLVFGTMITVVAEAVKNMGTALGTGLKILSGAIQAFVGLVTGDWTKFTGGLSKIWNSMWALIKSDLDRWIGYLKGLITGFTTGVSDAFKGMYDAVVGHSYVPDMIEGIRGAFGKLEQVMLDPTRRAANGVMSSFKNMFDTVMNFARDWKGSLKGLFEDIVGGFDLKGILNGDFSSILGSIKDTLGIGGGASSKSGGILSGIFGGSGGGSGGTAGINAAMGWAGVGASLIDPIANQLNKIGAGRDSANEIVKSQNAFQAAIGNILNDSGLSATNKFKQVANLWEGMQANLGRFSASGGENTVTANQAFATLSPFVSKVQSDLIKAGASDGSTPESAGNTYNFGGMTWNVVINDTTDPQSILQIIKNNVAGVTEEIKRQMELKEGAVVSR
jgi:TP901 family phage tail tape measure protein